MPRISLGEDLGGGRVGEAKPTLAGGGLAKPSELAPTRCAGHVRRLRTNTQNQKPKGIKKSKYTDTTLKYHFPIPLPN